MNAWSQRIILVGLGLFLIADTAFAQRGRGGGGRGGGGRGGGGMRGGGGGMRAGGGGFPSRGGARSSVTRPSRPGGGNIANRPGNIGGRPGGGNVINNRPGNITNVDRGNINVNRQVNVGDVDGGWGGYGDWNDGCCFNHPVAAAAAIGTAAAITSAAIGSVVYSVPSSCTATVVNGITYEQCDGTWYQPQFIGTETSYVVVSPP